MLLSWKMEMYAFFDFQDYSWCIFQENDDDDEEEETAGGAATESSGKKKKKKKKSNKKKKPASTAVPSKLPHCRLLGGFTDYYVKLGQTEPPTRPVADLFPNGGFPVGEIQEHHKTKYPDPSSSYSRVSEEEKRSDAAFTFFIIFLWYLTEKERDSILICMKMFVVQVKFIARSGDTLRVSLSLASN